MEFCTGVLKLGPAFNRAVMIRYTVQARAAVYSYGGNCFVPDPSPETTILWDGFLAGVLARDVLMAFGKAGAEALQGPFPKS